MKLENFEVISPAGAGFGVGAVLRLTAAQAASRARSLEPLAATDCYRVTGPVVFKCGETVGAYPAAAPRAFFVGLAEIDGGAKAPRRGAKKAVAERKASARSIFSAAVAAVEVDAGGGDDLADAPTPDPLPA